ncbi:hypothetical protein CR513_43669, partial [Mucuna pruriens]
MYLTHKHESFKVFSIFYKLIQNEKGLRTPQQNGVVERKNRSLQEMARTMLNDNSTPKHLCSKAINTTCYL